MITCFTIAFSLLVIYLLYSLVTPIVFYANGRYRSVTKVLIGLLSSNFSSALKPITGSLLISLFVVLALINFMGNIPLMNIPSMYYFFRVSISLTL